MIAATESKYITPNILADLLKAKAAGLTKRETEATSWAAEGKTDDEIGMIIDCTARTAKAHVQNAMKKTDTHTRAQLVAMLFIKEVFAALRDNNTTAMLCLSLSLFITGELLKQDQQSMLRGNPRTTTLQALRTIRTNRQADGALWIDGDLNHAA